MIDDIASDVRAQAVPPVDGRRARAGFWLVAAVYTLVTLGGTLPIPLYALWAPRMGFGPFTTTLVFAVYALGTVLALMAFASLSDRVGRRPLLAAAVLATATSTALFLLADDVGTLLAARFLCGICTGVFTATATAALGELAGAEHTRRVPTVSTAANMGGLGLGTVVAGLFAQYGANPTHLVCWALPRRPGPSVPGRHRHPGAGHGGAVDHRAPAGSGIPHSGRRGVRGRVVGTVTADVRCRNAPGGYRHRPGLPPRCRGRPAARRPSAQGGSDLHVLPVRLHRHDRAHAGPGTPRPDHQSGRRHPDPGRRRRCDDPREHSAAPPPPLPERPPR
ncbi:MFS transporter [Streptomyces mirabilis]|uniref:MFS transporter n=1 Tax=Streptomyces mirabilis TaxID=68239 RepID=UPI0036B68CE7